MFNRLESVIKNLSGNVLVIGLDEKLIEKLNHNNNINLYSISSNKSTSTTKKSKKRITNNGKTINIKRLRKYINKKSTNYIICNMNEMMSYYKYFIKDSIFLNNNTIYIYANNDIDKNFLIKRYKRYNVKLTVNEYKNGYIIKIDSSLAKNNFIKDKLYLLSDTFYNIAETIGNILIS